MTVKTEPGLEPQRIAGAQSRRHDFLLAQQEAREAGSLVIGKRDLETVLAGIAGAGHHAVGPFDAHGLRRHELHVPASGGETRQHFHRPGSLQRQERPVLERRDLQPAGETVAEVVKVGRLAGGVDDHVEVIVGADDDDIVENTARLVGQHGVTHGPGREPLDVARHHRLDGLGHIAARERHLPHMADIEEGGPGAGMEVLGDDAAGEPDRHLVAGERHHSGAHLDMEVEQRRPLQFLWCGIGQWVLQQLPDCFRAIAAAAVPSVFGPERFTGRRAGPRPAYIFGEASSVRFKAGRLLSRASSPYGPSA